MLLSRYTALPPVATPTAFTLTPLLQKSTKEEYNDIGLRSRHSTLKFSNGDTYTGGFLEGYQHRR
eukprot:11946091-Ditylum_brightwellii.AAC.1